jgi:hypothetical protein
MRKSDNPTSRDYDDYVASALGTEGGHLSIGRGGFTYTMRVAPASAGTNASR